MSKIAYYYFKRHGILPWVIYNQPWERQTFIKACYIKEQEELEGFIKFNKDNPFANPGWIPYFDYKKPKELDINEFTDDMAKELSNEFKNIRQKSGK